jgi:hypothetical protein
MMLSCYSDGAALLPAGLILLQDRSLQTMFHLLLTEKVKSFIRIHFGLIRINLNDSLRGGITSWIGLPGVVMAKDLVKIIEQKKAAIVKKWFDLTAQTYAPDTAEFLKSKTDPFANPVGGSMLSSLNVLLDQLIHDMDPQTINSFLDPIIRIRAVQNFTPSQATAFVLSLKKALRENLAKELRDPSSIRELFEFESKIDQLSLMAFDIYMQCREKIYQISANETRNRTFRAFERAGLVSEITE